MNSIANSNKNYMYCNKCGKKILKDSTFCNKCGNKIQQVNTKIIDESKEDMNCINPSEKINTNNNLNKKSNKSNKIIAIIIFSILAIHFTLGIIYNFTRGTDFSETGAFISLIVSSLIIITSIYFIIKNIIALKEKNAEKIISKKNKSKIIIISLIIILGIFGVFFVIKNDNALKEQEYINSMQKEIIQLYTDFGANANEIGSAVLYGKGNDNYMTLVEYYMTLSKTELESELNILKEQEKKLLEMQKKYKDVIEKADNIKFEYKINALGYEYYNTANNTLEVVIPDKVTKTQKFFHINKNTNKVDTIWCVVKFDYYYGNGTKLGTLKTGGTGYIKYDVNAGNGIVYNAKSIVDGTIKGTEYMSADNNHIVAIRASDVYADRFEYVFFDNN